MKRNRSIRINFSEQEWVNIEILIERYNSINAQEMIRSLISEQFLVGNPASAYNGAKAQQKRVSRKSVQESHEYMIRNMSDVELSRHLKEIGYFPDDDYIHFIETTPRGRFYVQSIGAEGSDSYHRREVFNMDELIADIRKEKKL